MVILTMQYYIIQCKDNTRPYNTIKRAEGCCKCIADVCSNAEQPQAGKLIVQ